MLKSRARNAVKDILPVWFALALLTTAPYLVAFFRAPAGRTFTGILTAYDDTFTYLAWMRQGTQGRILFCDPYTSEPHNCVFFFPLFAILGFASRLTGMSLVVTFHTARLLSALGLIVVARDVARRVMKSRRRVRYTLWLYAMSGGVGWLVYILNNRGDLLGAITASGAADLNMPEAIAFRSVFAQVHFVVGIALTGWAINSLFIALAEQKRKRAFIAGALVSALAVAHPYQVVVVIAVAAFALLLWPWLQPSQGSLLKRYSAPALTGLEFAITSLPGVGYLTYLNLFNETLRGWLTIADTYSPPPIEYILGFGLALAFAIAGFRWLQYKKNTNGQLLLIWAVAQAATLYAPTPFQRRFIEGLQMPLIIAASVGLFWFAGRLKNWKTAFLIAVVIVASLTNIGFAVGQIVARSDTAAASDPRRYIPADLVAAMNWLNANAQRDDVLMSSYMTGSIAPSMTGLRVYHGHYSFTLKALEKGEQVRSFYSGSLAGEPARRLLANGHVKYVIYGPFERAISSSFVAPEWLALVWSEGDAQIYRVIE